MSLQINCFLSKSPRIQSSQFYASSSLFLFCDVSVPPDSVAQLLHETTSSCGFSSITLSWLLTWLSHLTCDPAPEPWLTPFKLLVWSKAPTMGFSCSSCPRSQAHGFCCPYAEGFHISLFLALTSSLISFPITHSAPEPFYPTCMALTLHGWNRIPGTLSLPSLSCLTPFLWKGIESQGSYSNYKALPSLLSSFLLILLFFPLFQSLQSAGQSTIHFLSASVLGIFWPDLEGPSLSLVRSFFPTSGITWPSYTQFPITVFLLNKLLHFITCGSHNSLKLAWGWTGLLVYSLYSWNRMNLH